MSTQYGLLATPLTNVTVFSNATIKSIYTNSMTVRIPAPWEPHSCCWMAWAVHSEWADWTNVVKAELEAVIRSISHYELVRLLTPLAELGDARARFSGSNIEIIEAPVDDIWMRDIAPTFALSDSEIVGIDWNFSSWGGTKVRPPRKGDRIARETQLIFGVPRHSTSVVAEGGALITDGQGTLITTRSCLLHPTRNPVHKSYDRKTAIEKELSRLGIRRVVWLEGDPCEPGTNGHVDGYVMFTAPGAVLVEDCNDDQCEPPMWRSHDIALLQAAQDAAGRLFHVDKVLSPRRKHWKFKGSYFAACYVNAYIANGAVITARFGDKQRDEAAMQFLQSAFPLKKIVMLDINHVASGGGGIHCLTQPMPAAPGIASSRI